MKRFYHKLNKEMNMRYFSLAAIALLLSVSDASAQKYTTKQMDGYTLVTQRNGATLGYCPQSGVKLIRKDGYAFKDLNRNGRLDPYEDWRLDIDTRVADLAAQLSKEEIAGLMLYSSHQAVPASKGWTLNTWGGQSYDESGAKPWDLSDQQKQFLRDDNLRHVLITSVESPFAAARWNNTAQAFVEGLGHGIPNNNSSDPRHTARSDSEFNAGGGGDISMWPSELGMGATFDPALMRRFGEIASTEYRALGFTTALSPQIDIATDPRWFRFSGTYSEDPHLVADMAEAYCDAFQTSSGADALYGAWGMNSVNAMAKHWPGGGPCEAGRDAHFGRGKFAVYPNNNLALQKIPFIKGAFNLGGGTGQASAVMPYYTTAWGQSDEYVANNFNRDIIDRQLRQDAHYDGVVCTDWGVTADEVHPGFHSGKPWGVEHLTVAERHCKALIAGVDQFGGNNDKLPVLQAFELMAKEIGEEQMQKRIRESARRLLRNIFRTGLFENPYLDPEHSAALVGSPEFMAAGYDAQLKSVVMIKNHHSALPVVGGEKVYIPSQVRPARLSFWGSMTPADTVTHVKKEFANRYVTTTDNVTDADAAIVFIDSPQSGYGHDLAEAIRKNPEAKQHIIDYYRTEYGQDVTANGEFSVPSDNNYYIKDSTKVSCLDNAYYPISLQYEDYTADSARAVSIAGGDPSEPFMNRSYRGKSVRTINRCDLEQVREMRKALGDKKLIVVINTVNPAVLSEIEPLADAILVIFDIQKQAVMDIISGQHEPSGLLPFQMPADMLTVEQQAEDTPRDMRCYRDADGNTYDFAFGMNWKGVIRDKRVERYY